MVHSPPSQVLRFLSRVARSASEQPDAQLLEQFVRDHDDEAFETLLRRYAGLVWGVCRRALGSEHDAEDVFQVTFLVLAQQAAHIRKPDSLASWLHGTALRMTQRAKRDMARRHKHEHRAACRANVEVSDTALRELQAVIDEEVQRLPEKYRTAFTLCVLDGRSQKAAAGLLGCDPGTVATHLFRARRRLQRQLVRRGVTLSAALTAAALTQHASAKAPSLMIRATLQAAQAPASTLSAGVVALLQGAPFPLGATHKLWGILLLSISFGAVCTMMSTVLFHGPVKAEPRTVLNAKANPADRRVAQPVTKNEKIIDIRGCVLDANGKPAAGARLYLLGAKRSDTEAIASADAQGKFHFAAEAEEVGLDGRVLATGPGHAPDWVDLARFEKGEVTLRLRKDDVPFIGQVVTLEGQPVVGATIEAKRIGRPAGSEELKPWIDNNVKLRKENFWVNENGLLTVAPSMFGQRMIASTDKDGRFRLSGAGRDRVLSVRVQSSGVEHKYFWVVTRRDAPKDGYIKTGDFNYGLYGPEITVLVGPSKPIVGTVRDRATGKPISGIMVQEANHNVTSAVTGMEGHYRLEGVPKKQYYHLTAAGKRGLSYFDSFRQDIRDTAGVEPISVDFALDRGLEITGRVVDKTTGKTLAGQVHYDAAQDNPHLKDYPSLSLFKVVISDWGRVDSDGKYTVLAIPGPGAVSVCAKIRDRYPTRNAEQELRKLNVRSFPTDPVHAVIPVNPDETKPESLLCNIELNPGKSRKGKVSGPNGTRLYGVQVAGLVPGGRPERMALSAFMTTGLGERKRILLFLHPGKNLGRMVELSGASEEPVTVRLQPLGSIEGKVLDREGKPWAGLKVTLRPEAPSEEYDNLPDEITTFQGLSGIQRGLWSRFLGKELTTDKDGYFRLEGVLPGVDFFVCVSDGDLAKNLTLVAMRNHIRVEAGKATELGVLKKGDGVTKNDGN